MALFAAGEAWTQAFCQHRVGAWKPSSWFIRPVLWAAFLSPHTCPECSPSPPHTTSQPVHCTFSLKLRKELLSLSLRLASTFFCLALFTGGGGVFILWKLAEAKQSRLLLRVGVCLCVCSFLSMWHPLLSYLSRGSCLLPSAEC